LGKSLEKTQLRRSETLKQGEGVERLQKYHPTPNATNKQKAHPLTPVIEDWRYEAKEEGTW
jgi:hypothetical protein